MAKTIAVTDSLYAQLASLARPFTDKEPADVISWLVQKELGPGNGPSPPLSSVPVARVNERAPRERGVVVDLDGVTIRADSVPDLFRQVMDFLHGRGRWNDVLALAPYKTSAKRYLFSTTPVHPNGNDFFVPLVSHGLHVEAHKNYPTTVEQLTRFLSKLGVTMTYKGT